MFLAWSKQERAGQLLESALAALAPIALRALDVTGRPVPEPLAALAGVIRESVPDAESAPLGPTTGALAARLRTQVYGPGVDHTARRDLRTGSAGPGTS